MTEVHSFSGWWMVLISYVPSGESLPGPQGDRGAQFLWLVDGFNQLRTKWGEFARAPGWQRCAVSLVGGWF